MKTEDHQKPNRVGIIVLLILAISGIGYLGYWLAQSKYVSTDEASVNGDHVSVSAKIMGRIRSLTAEEGAKIEAGQLLVILDDTDLRAQEAQSAAALNSAKQNLVLSKVNLDKAQTDFERTKALFDNGVTSKEQYDHATNALEASKVQYSIAQAQIDTAKAQLGVIETQLLNTKITAPISGIVAKRLVMPGEVVQPGQSIYLINSENSLWVTANFEETKIRLIHPQAPVEVSIDAYPNHPFKGKVVQIGADIVEPPFQIGESTKTTQKIPVKIVLNQVPKSISLLPGMSAEVKIKVK